jgi:hypothetical protein
MVKREQHQLIVQHKKCGVEIERGMEVRRVILKIQRIKNDGERELVMIHVKLYCPIVETVRKM